MINGNGDGISCSGVDGDDCRGCGNVGGCVAKCWCEL